MTPGHTPGHTCLYLKEKGILFAGDHILYDITPNIGVWEGVEDSLGDYLDSLKKIDKLPFKTAYPAHREITSRMKWSIRCRAWSDFPKNQKWFAMGEALAHLDWLRKQNDVKHIFKDGILKFYPSEKPYEIIV